MEKKLIKDLKEMHRQKQAEKEQVEKEKKFALYVFDCIRHPQPNRNIHDFEGEE